MRDLYPGYDVLAKRDTPSWNEQTRIVIDRRLAIDPDEHRFFTDTEWITLQAICAHIVPQPERANPVPIAAMVDLKMHEDIRDGYRDARMPRMQEAWRRGLAALDAEAQAAHGAPFHALPADRQDGLLAAMQKGELRHEAWSGMPSDAFFKMRIVTDVVKSYYAHPTAWNEIGWGGPAGPRGYVRMDFDRRDPWEAAEAKPAREDEAYRENRRVER
jgi:hypothetical protein